MTTQTDRALIQQLRELLLLGRDEIQERFFEQGVALQTLQELAQLNEQVIQRLWDQLPPESEFSLLALAGYGRREVFPASDLDLLVLDHSLPGRPAAGAIRQLLQALWDLGYRVGQQVWRWSELESLGREDFQFLLSLSDARPLAGSSRQSDRLLGELLPAKLEEYRRQLGRFVHDWTQQRHRNFRDTIYQLEPDLKEAPGGLRDYQVGRWIARLTGVQGFLPYRADELTRAFAFMCGLRVFVHYFRGRDRNLLTHDMQAKIVPHFGYRGVSARSAVESLMKEYFLRARMLNDYCAKALEVVAGPPAGRIGPEEAGPLETLAQVLALFERCRRRRQVLSDPLRNRILENLPGLSEGLAYAELAGPLLELFQPRPGLYESLSELYDLGVLELLFPEFGNLRGRVIRDFYHRYTVDEHSLLAIKTVEELAAGLEEADPRFSSLLEELARPELLTLTLLLHDVGKSRGGKHVDTGARMAAKALRRFRLDQEFVDTVVFLIRNHLAMSAVMLKRNIEDSAEVTRFGDLVGDPSTLRLLTLLTYADIKAVAPGALNQWKRDRLWQLFVATYNHLTLGYGEERIEADSIREILEPKLPSDIEFDELENFLKGFPSRYIHTTPPEEILAHYRLGRALSAEAPVQVKLTSRRSHWELCVVTADRHRMFSRIAGLLAYFDMNILRGYAFSNRRDTVLDFFQFADTQQRFRPAAERRRFRQMLGEAIQDRIDVEELLARKEGGFLFTPPSEPRTPMVRFDSGSQHGYSIMEIVASDSLGLLYRISREISSLGCNIELVLISTEGNKAVDVFYLTYQGDKLDADLRARLTENITRAIG